jgi:predicted membrane channel-forming protein YqfA (hemolysin III family)
MVETRHNEKEDEKRGEKQEEKKGGWDEKWQRDRVNAISWAAMLVWGAVVLLIATPSTAAPLWRDHGWSIFLIGAGAIVLLTALYRWLRPEHRRPLIGSFIIGTILFGVGLGDVAAWSENIIWVVVLIAIACGILLSAFRRR